MRSVTGTVESIVSSARRLVRLDRSADTRRHDFSQAFGKYPPYQEASNLDREQFVLEVVRPVLAQRAQAVQDGVQRAGPGSRVGTDAFARAYQVAVDMGLAEKDRTYRDYLDA